MKKVIIRGKIISILRVEIDEQTKLTKKICLQVHKKEPHGIVQVHHLKHRRAQPPYMLRFLAHPENDAEFHTTLSFY